MNTQTNNTVNPITLVANLFTAIDAHQSAVDATNVTYVTREQALKAFKDAGYTSVQDGRKRGGAKRGEVPNNEELKSFFNARFLSACNAFHLSKCDKSTAENKELPVFVAPTEAQISANLKQQISCLNYYLKTGTFTTNVGRDKFKHEQLETFKAIDILEKKAKAEQAKADKAKKELEALAKKQAEADADALAKAEADAEAKLKAEAEAKLLAEAEAEALAKALNNPTQANKRALAKAKAEAEALAKDKAKAEALAKAEADRLKAEADKLVKRVQSEALAKVRAQADADKAEAEAKRLKAEAEAKAKAKAKKPQDDTQILENIYKSAINNLTESQIEELINKLTLYLDLG